MILGGTLAAYAAIERKAEELLTQDHLYRSLKQDRDRNKELLSLFKEQRSNKHHFWMLTAGAVFLRTDKAKAFRMAMKNNEQVSKSLQEAAEARKRIALEIVKDPALNVVNQDPNVNSVLREVLEAMDEDE